MGLLETAKPFGDKPHFYNICLYGNPGLGKTVLACSAPGALELQCERNAGMSLRNHPTTAHVPCIDIDESHKIIDLYWELKKNPGSTRTVVVDTISELQMRNLSEIWKAEQKKGKRPEGHPYQQDYKVNTEFMREVILLYCDLPMNVIFVCHETEEKNEIDGSTTTRPTFTPKLAATMFATVDVMAFMSAEINTLKNEMKRMIRVTPTRSIKAKDRLGLPSTFDADQFWTLVSG